MLTLEEIRAHFRRHDPCPPRWGLRCWTWEGSTALSRCRRHGCQLNRHGSGARRSRFRSGGCGVCALSNANGLYCTNAQTSISFVRSGRVGPLRGEARVLRSGKLLSTYEVRVTDAEGGLVAVATITGYGVGARLPLGDA